MTVATAGGALPISNGHLALSALLIVVNVVLSGLLRLELGRPLLLAATRMVVQLLLIGAVLEWLFRQEDPLAIALLALAMAGIAGAAAVNRTRRRFAGIYANSLLSVL
ncbi:MAG TPA: ABC transporter permease, partial [Cyanobium sp.]|nr:ABC transporter permease [Cyanobium sp.]